MVNLPCFVEFLSTSNHIKDYTNKLIAKFFDEYNSQKQIQEKEIKKIIKLANKIRQKYPQLDDSKTPYPKTGVQQFKYYEETFAGFNKIAKQSSDKESIVNVTITNDNSKLKLLLNIINIKIQKYNHQGETKSNFDNTLYNEFLNLQAERLYNYREWLNSCRISAGHSIIMLLLIIDKINKKPILFKNIKDRHTHLQSNITKLMFDSDRWVEQLTYGTAKNNKSDEKFDTYLERLKIYTKNGYEAIREELGGSLLTNQIINKYKTRSVWYNFQEIWDLVKNKNGTFSNKREHLLTLHFARYLFDHGISIIYKMRAGQHELDMVDPDTSNPLVVEVKVYKDNSAKQILIKGIAQLHSYLVNLSSTRTINEGYYVIYRFGGPIYEFPEKIATNKFIINTILIDLGRSDTSGRKQPKPIIISKDEIMLKSIKRIQK
ncbi:MAG: hypothetical protein KAT05_02210 [Spirochaetes bacterium]|nr:hypothetical protein [Spirochaetota bacterium]MCK5609153.1 hypothetical protein [Candidatus Pacearchaeota archaeon]